MLKKLLFLFTITIFQVSYSADFFWIGGTGNWSDVNHWSATSGGAAGAILPTNADNVIFDNNSGLASAANIVTMDVAVVVDNFDYSAVPTPLQHLQHICTSSATPLHPCAPALHNLCLCSAPPLHLF